ncbi:U4/U6-U5 snRNP complex subunit lsm6, partial [Biomphalaria glabrata]
MSRRQSPSEFLNHIRGRPVVMNLNFEEWIIDVCCLVDYMNIALEQTEEYVNDQLKNNYGDAFIRGNSVLCISRPK